MQPTLQAKIKNFAIAVSVPVVLLVAHGAMTPTPEEKQQEADQFRQELATNQTETAVTSKYTDILPEIEANEAQFLADIKEYTSINHDAMAYVSRRTDLELLDIGYEACNKIAEQGYAIALMNDVDTLQIVRASEGMITTRRSAYSASHNLCPEEN